MRHSKCHVRLQNGRTICLFPCTRKQNRIESKPEVVGGGPPASHWLQFPQCYYSRSPGVLVWSSIVYNAGMWIFCFHCWEECCCQPQKHYIVCLRCFVPQLTILKKLFFLNKHVFYLILRSSGQRHGSLSDLQCPPHNSKEEMTKVRPETERFQIP